MGGSPPPPPPAAPSGSSSSSSAAKKCGVGELGIFLAAIAAGTACSICSKTMMRMHGVGITGQVEPFSKPIFQTLGMFVGMMFGLVMHAAVLVFRIPFPGYDHRRPAPLSSSKANGIQLLPTTAVTASGGGAAATERDALLRRGGAAPASPPPPSPAATATTPGWMYFFLAIPSVFDLAATALCMMGLRYLDVSVYQLLRGSGIIFVALMKQHVLGDRLYRFQWVGVAYNVLSVLFVGSTAVLNSQRDEAPVEPAEAALGVLLVMAGAFVQALQFVFEEKVMTMDEASAPPLLLIGMEGLWGTALCLLVVYPVVYYLPGDDHGSYEDPFNTWAMLAQTAGLQRAFAVYFFAIFAYNLFAVLVTFALNSVWHAILDNFRPITVWGTDMFIYYAIAESGNFGEPWTRWSWVQLLGMAVLLFGTAVYNAPNPGSVRLKGQWYSLGVDLTSEYDEVEHELREEEREREWEARKSNFLLRRPSSIPGDPTFAALLPSAARSQSHHPHGAAAAASAAASSHLIPPRNPTTSTA